MTEKERNTKRTSLTDEKLIERFNKEEIDEYMTLEYLKENVEQRYRLGMIDIEERTRQKSIYQNRQNKLITLKRNSRTKYNTP